MVRGAKACDVWLLGRSLYVQRKRGDLATGNASLRSTATTPREARSRYRQGRAAQPEALRYQRRHVLVT